MTESCPVFKKLIMINPMVGIPMCDLVVTRNQSGLQQVRLYFIPTFRLLSLRQSERMLREYPINLIFGTYFCAMHGMIDREPRRTCMTALRR